MNQPAGTQAPGRHPVSTRGVAMLVALVLVGCTPSEAAPRSPRADAAGVIAPGSGPYGAPDRGTRRQATPSPLPPMTCAPGSIVRTVDTGGVKLVAFGFDDGPWPVTTESIMTELERRGMRATFFMIGAHLDKYPDIGRSVVARGHEAGNHTLSHQYTTKVIMKEIVPAANLIATITGAYPRLFRSPGLSTSATLQNALAYLSLCNIFHVRLHRRRRVAPTLVGHDLQPVQEPTAPRRDRARPRWRRLPRDDGRGGAVHARLRHPPGLSGGDDLGVARPVGGQRLRPRTTWDRLLRCSSR